MLYFRCWASWIYGLVLSCLVALGGSGSALAGTPPDQGYLNIDTAQALIDPTMAAAFMTIEVAPDAQSLIRVAAFDFSNGTEDAFIPIWSQEGRPSRYIVYPGVKDKFGLPPGKYALVWQWVRRPSGRSENTFFGGWRKRETSEGDEPTPSFEVGPGERIYLGHFRFSYGGKATVVTRSASMLAGETPPNNDSVDKLFSELEKAPEESKAEKPYLNLTVEDRYDEFVATLPADIGVVRKSLLTLSKRRSVVVLQ